MFRLPTTVRFAAAANALAAVCLLMSGCYDADQLIHKVRNSAARNQLREISLGTFRVTLPHDARTSEMTEIDIRIFGQSKRYKIDEIEAELAAKAPQIEDSTLRALRETSRRDLAEPNLKGLRERLLETMNQELTNAPLESIGFYDVRFIRH